jgi:hypothetical protein
MKNKLENKPEKNYIPDSISFIQGFRGPKGDVGYLMVADYKKAKKIILNLLQQGKNIKKVEMGLDGDWTCNSCIIFDENGHHKYNCYDSSIWAEPIMIVFYKDAPSEKYSVWRQEKEKK